MSLEPTPIPDGDNLITTDLPPKPEIHGNVHCYFETGTEGVLWSVIEDGKEGYDSLVVLNPGDHLTIKNPEGSVLFCGVIDQDREIGWKHRYPGATHGQPVARGMWVHWTQRGFEPDAWADLFLDEANRAVVIKASDLQKSA